MSNARDIILARRARFVAAALAGTGLAAPTASAQPTEDPPDCEADPEACSPRICLSDISIEGELTRPPSDCPDGQAPDADGQCPPEPDTAPVPRICLSLIPPDESVARRHDGFYLRLSAGPGWLFAATDGDRGAGTVRGYSGTADLGFGVTPTPGLTAGFLVGFSHAPAPDAKGGAQGSGGGATTLLLVGPLVDYFPDARAGFHVAGAAGFLLTFRAPDDAADEALNGPGFGGALWLGYDAWVADEWSLGAQLKGHAGVSWTGTEQVSERILTRSVALMFSVLWH